MQPHIRWPNLWRFLFACSLLCCAVAMPVNWLTGASGRISEGFLWSLTSALTISGGLSLAAGGYTIAGIVAVLGGKPYLPLHRLALMIACSGFIAALAATFLQFRITWAGFWELWSPQSLPAPAGVSALLCIGLVTRESFRSHTRWKNFSQSPSADYVATLITCLAAVIAALQQMAFLRIVGVAPNQFSLIWSGPMLSVDIFLSDICLALALLVVAYWHFGRMTNKYVEVESIEAVSKVMRVVLPITIGLRMLELTDMGQWHNLFHSHLHDYLFGLELVLLITPALYLFNRRAHEYVLDYQCSIMVLAGVILNRLNLAITSREAVVGSSFTPRIMDMLLAFATIFAGFSIFVWLLKRDPILTAGEQQSGTLVVRYSAAGVRT